MSALQDLSKGYNNIGTKLIDNSGLVAARLFQQLGSWRDDDVKTYIEILTASLDGAKLQASQSTVSFYSQMAQLNGQDLSKPALVMSDLSTKKLRGVGSEIVYKRPFVDMRTQLSKGKTFKEAVDAGARRAASLASTEVQLARRNTGLQIRNENDRIVGYIRTLTGAESCALCNVASTQRYRRGDLMPIHPGCDCGEMPIFGNQDPGQVINDVRLDAIQENVESRFGIQDAGARAIDYRKIAIREHGELGPVLTIAKNNTETIGEVGKLYGVSRLTTPLSKKQTAALNDYTSSGFRDINTYLRQGESADRFLGIDPEDFGFFREQIKDIDEAMEVAYLNKDASLIRAANVPELDIIPNDKIIGKIFNDGAFVSASNKTTPSADFFSQPGSTVFKIQAPKGTRALDANGLKVTRYEAEKEIILDRNIRYRIVKAEDETYGSGVTSRVKRTITMEVVLDE
jgi:hypothetical protein